MEQVQATIDLGNTQTVPTPVQVANTMPTTNNPAPAQPVSNQAAPAQPVSNQAAPVQPVSNQAAPVQPVSNQAAAMQAVNDSISNPSGTQTVVPDVPKIDTSVLAGTEITTVSALFWNDTLNVLKQLTKKNTEHLLIHNGKISLNYDYGVVNCDLTKSFGKHSVYINEPERSLKMLSLLNKEDDITIMDNTGEYIVYGSRKNSIRDAVHIRKFVHRYSDISQLETKDEYSSQLVVSTEIAEALINAKKVIESDFYRLVIDLDTYEILSIEIDGGAYVKYFKDATGRNTGSYKVPNLFIINKNFDTLIRIYNIDNSTNIHVKTITDTNIGPLTYTIEAKLQSNADSTNISMI